MAGCKPKKFAKGGMATNKTRPTGLGPVVLEPPRRAPAPAPMAPPRPTPASPMRAPMQLPVPQRPAPMIVGGKGQGNPFAMGPGGRQYESGQSQEAINPAATQTQLSAAAAQGQRVPANVAAGIQADAAKAFQGFNAQRMGQGMGSQSAPPMGRAFKKGGMVNAKKKSSSSSSVRPRGSSGKGVKSCKVC